ncbi:MAG: hypothetical protein ACOCWR_01570 [Oceanidesulfovibrio sp.]
MEWYEEDFEAPGGVVPFVKQYAEGIFEKEMQELGDNVEVEFQSMIGP